MFNPFKWLLRLFIPKVHVCEKFNKYLTYKGKYGYYKGYKKGPKYVIDVYIVRVCVICNATHSSDKVNKNMTVNAANLKYGFNINN